MKTFKALYLTLAFLAFAGMSKAQDVELGILLGAAQYQGDLSESHITFPETKLGLGGLFRYYFNPRLNAKIGLYQGWIAGDDNNYANNPDRYRRNLSFKSSITELSGHLEWNILPYISNSTNHNWAPYLFGGVGVFRFNPKAELNGQMHELQPLGTEGQFLQGSDKDPYSLWQVAIPYGIGVKVSLGNLWNLGLEIGQRKLFTDYLDDVSTRYPDMAALTASDQTAAALSNRASEQGLNPWKEGQQRGNPDDLDMYIFAGFTLTKTLRKYSCKDF